MKKYLLILVTFLIPYLTLGQSYCFEDFQLLKMHRSTVSEISSFLINEEWEVTTSATEVDVQYFGYPIDYKMITWGKNTDNSIFLFYKPGFKNIVIVNGNKDCFNYLFSRLSSNRGLVFQSEQVDNFLIQRVKINPLTTIEFRQLVNKSNVEFDGGVNDYSILIYEKLVLDKEVAKAKKKYVEIEKQKIDFADEVEKEFGRVNSFIAARQYNSANDLLGIIEFKNKRSSDNINPNRIAIEAKVQSTKMDIFIAEVDGILEKKDYQAAKDRVSTYLISHRDDDNGTLTEKLEEIKSLQIEFELSKLSAHARELEVKGDYQAALLIFKQIVQDYGESSGVTSKIADLNSKITAQKLSSLRQIVGIAEKNNDFNSALKAQQEIFSLVPNNAVESKKYSDLRELAAVFEKRKYHVYNYKETNPTEVTNYTYKLSNSLTSIVNAQSSGEISLKLQMSFDTLGSNYSNLNYKRVSNRDFVKTLTNDASLLSLPPSKMNRFFVSSNYEKSVDVNWNTRQLTFDKFSSTSLNESEFKGDEVAANFVNKNALYGKYVFSVKDVTIDNELNSYYTLSRFGGARGPLNAFLSLVIPGLGTLRTSYGEKGWNRLTWFILTSALSYGSKVYSDSEYQNYLNATNKTDSDMYYESANNFNYASIGFASISASIYVGDFLSSFVNGVKNVNRGSNFRKKVRDFPITLNRLKIQL